MSLSAIASTTRAINPPIFRKNSALFKPEKYSQSGRGFVAQKYPVYPAIPLRPWESNTAIELKNIVFPDGVPKNSTAAQERINEEREKDAVKVTIQKLEEKKRAISGPGAAARRATIQEQIDSLELKYFPGERNDRLARERHEIEMKEGQGNANAIVISAQGHAAAAKAERDSILNELRLIRTMGLVSGAGIPAPPSLVSSAPLSPSATLGTSTVSSPALSTMTTSTSAKLAAKAPMKSSFPDEEKAIQNVQTTIGGALQIDNFDDIINALSSGTLDRATKSQLSLAATNELNRLDIRSKTKTVLDYMIKLALIQEGADVSLFDQIPVDRRTKKYDKVRQEVKTFLSRK